MAVVAGAPELLEREQEIEKLGQLLTAAVTGRGSAVVIEGAPGIGKTRLLETWCTQARERGMVVLSARGARLEREFGFGVARQLLEPAVRRQPAGDRNELLAGAAEFAAPIVDGRRTATRGDPPHAVYHGLYWLCSNLAERAPLVLAIDDAQWADLPSVRFLAYLVQRLDDMPVALAIGTRSVRPETLISQITASALVENIAPLPLTAGAVAQLVARRLARDADGAFVSACHVTTGGNPFLVNELLTELRRRAVPPSAETVSAVQDVHSTGVSRTVVGRLLELPEAATRVARSLAILGGEGDANVVAALAGLDLHVTLAGVDALAAVDIAAPAERPCLLHDIVRATIYAELPLAKRQAGHLRAARLLAERGVAPEHVASHLLRLVPDADAWVVEMLQRAAADALARGAPESAIAFLARALAERPVAERRAGLLAKLGATELMIGDAHAAEHLSAALTLLEDPVERAQLARTLAFALAARGDLQPAIDLLEDVIALVAKRDPDLALQLEAELATHAKFNAKFAHVARRRLAPLRSRADLPTLGGRMVSAELAIQALYEGAPADEAAQLAERSLEGGASGVFESPLGAAQYYQAVFVLLSAERFARASDLLVAALEEGRTRGSAMTIAVAAHWRGWLALRRGALRDAEADSRLALQLAREHGILAIEPGQRALVIEVLLARGDLAGAEAALESAGSSQIPDGLTLNFLLEARAGVRLAQGRHHQALADLEEFSRREGGLRAANPAASAWRFRAAIALHALGRTEDARRLAAQSVILARRFGAPSTVGVALHHAGLVEEPESGLPRLEEAVRILAPSPARLAYASTLLALGASLRRSGRRADARAPLRLAVQLADRCGATALRDRARHELLAAGGRPPRAGDGGVVELSASEHRIATMAASGQRNREIAQALFLSLKTVEMHLSHSYRKLGIHSRTELPAALAQDRAVQTQ